MVLVGGPDVDPPVQRDVTYILDRPTSRAYRVAYGTRWIVENIPQTDFIFYLDDDSFLNLRRLVNLMESVRHAETFRTEERMLQLQEDDARGINKDVAKYRNEA